MILASAWSAPALTNAPVAAAKPPVATNAPAAAAKPPVATHAPAAAVKPVVATNAPVAAVKPPVAINAPVAAAKPVVATAKVDRPFSYFRDEVPKVPWQIHVVKIDRSRTDYGVYALLGGGAVQGLSTVSSMVKQMPPAWGKPVAAINGDLFEAAPTYPGDPMGLHIANGELVSAPSPAYFCAWIGEDGGMFMTNVTPRFQAAWPDGRTVTFGLNRARAASEVVLYTPAVGASTRTAGGVEMVLERDGDSPWMPLRASQSIRGRVREVRRAGNTPVAAGTMVLSFGPALASLCASTTNGTVFTLNTTTSPSLAGTVTGISGGPALVRAGKVRSRSVIQARHPRTAVGWNATHLFLVVVDGRQRTSVGMTYSELADYMLKLGCTEALNLDGGGSVTCWLLGNVVNSPSQGAERPAANGLVLVQKNKP